MITLHVCTHARSAQLHPLVGRSAILSLALLTSCRLFHHLPDYPIHLSGVARLNDKSYAVKLQMQYTRDTLNGWYSVKNVDGDNIEHEFAIAPFYYPLEHLYLAFDGRSWIFPSGKEIGHIASMESNERFLSLKLYDKLNEIDTGAFYGVIIDATRDTSSR